MNPMILLILGHYGGRITTNDDVINSFLTSNKQVKKGNLSTHSYEQDNQMLLRNYGTLIATREGNDVSITNTKYSKTTTIITNKVNRMALDKGMNVNLTDKFAEGGETIKDEYNILVGRIGDEYYFYGTVETDVQATIYEMKYKINLGDAEFQASSNPSWVNGKPLYITEIALYDSSDDLMIISKLQSPTPRQGIQQFVIKFDF